MYVQSPTLEAAAPTVFTVWPLARETGTSPREVFFGLHCSFIHDLNSFVLSVTSYITD